LESYFGPHLWAISEDIALFRLFLIVAANKTGAPSLPGVEKRCSLVPLMGLILGCFGGCAYRDDMYAQLLEPIPDMFAGQKGSLRILMGCRRLEIDKLAGDEMKRSASGKKEATTRANHRILGTIQTKNKKKTSTEDRVS
jgi:hypothetical protein